MISLNYINGSCMEIAAFDPFRTYESEVSNILDDVATAYESYKEAINEYNLSVEFFEAGDDAKKNNVAEKKTNFVDKIGKAIISIFQKAISFVNNIITKIQESLFASKSDMQKVSALCKQNPGLADDINKAFASGDLKVADLKNLKELEAAYDECIRLAKQENVDPNTIKGKWLAAKKKFGNLSESDIVKGVTVGIGVAAAAGSLALTITKLPEAIGTMKQCKMRLQAGEDAAKEAAAKRAKAELDLKYAQNTYDDRLNEQRDKTKKAASDAYVAKKTEDDRINKSKSDTKKAAVDAHVAKATEYDQIAKSRMSVQAAKDAAKKEIPRNDNVLNGKEIKKFVNNRIAKESEEFVFDENGYMTESAADAVGNILLTISNDMCRVYTVIASYTGKTLSKAQTIIAAATKGWNKPTKASKEKEKEAEDKEEKKDDEE